MTATLPTGRVRERAPRIGRAARPPWWRRPRLLLGILGGLVGVWFVLLWTVRSATETIEVPVVDRLLIVNEAGPVTVDGGDRPTGEAVTTSSWWWRRPEVTFTEGDGGAVLRIRCRSWTPCRSSIDVDLPAAADVTVVAPDGAVLVTGIDGDLTVQAGGDVTLGPVGGSVRVVAPDGDVTGQALRPTELAVSAVGDLVSLSFASAPGMVVVRADDAPVELELPPAVAYDGVWPDGTVVDPALVLDGGGPRIEVDTAGSVTVVAGPDE